MTPVLIERAEGLGWLAATPPDHDFRIAVTAPTRAQAASRLQDRVAAWEAIPVESSTNAP